MNVALSQIATIDNSHLNISGSKSETNRLLLLHALYPNLKLENTSNSNDSEVMLKALTAKFSSEARHHERNRTAKEIDIHHAGTAMRFLTAYFAIQEGSEVILTGSARMKQRPIQILVEALQKLGADISYEKESGFPPLRIKGKKLPNHQVTLAANVSSQYISALLLIAPKLENGLELTLEGKITSMPYIQMTLNLLHQIGIETSFKENKINVLPNFEFKTKNPNPKIIVESDWSSASYFYSIVALSKTETKIQLSSFKENSLQGDSALVEIYKSFGVESTFKSSKLTLRKTTQTLNPEPLTLHLQNTPDIAQTLAVTCFGLGIACRLTGLHTLKIKETDRLEALQRELSKLGAKVTITEDTLTLEASSKKVIATNEAISTYNDHRMAMAFAPLALRVPIIIQDAEVVSKSYPNFWNDLKNIGFQISEIK